MINLEEMLIENPVVAAVKNEEGLETAIKMTAPIVFLIFGSILNIEDMCKRLKQAGKTVFIHVDLLDGIKSDISGIEFLKKYAKPDGIISTKTANIKHGKQLGLLCIQRLFIIDSSSLVTGIRSINETMPDAVEIMPGVSSKTINKLNGKINIPLIASGLITTKEDVMEALASGAVAISTTQISLWDK